MLVHLDLQLAAVQHDDDTRSALWRIAASPARAKHIGDRRAGGAGARGQRLPHAALEDTRADASRWSRVELGEPGDVRAIGKELMTFDRGAFGGEIEGRQ